MHWYLTLQKQLCKKAKKSCRGFPQKLFFQKKEQIWSCMGKQCKMCFLGYGQFFFFSGMDRLLPFRNFFLTDLVVPVFSMHSHRSISVARTPVVDILKY